MLTPTKRNIVLIGLPGCGKTTLGRQAAEAFGLDFLDLDDEIERQAGRSISEIFDEEGEEGFRERESAVAEAASQRRGIVIATGGGIVLRQLNMRALGETGLIVFIDRPPERIVQDVSTGRRPLLVDGAERVYTLSDQRRALYLKYADATIRNDADPEEAMQRLRALMYGVFPPSGGFAVIGDPIGHTLSPPIHRAVFGQVGCDAPYVAIHVPKGTLSDFAALVRSSCLRGFNVTIPHKQEIVQYLDEIDSEAALCGAVNTVLVLGGRLKGYNTDMGGLLEALRSRGYGFSGRRVTIMGTGGAAHGAAVKAAMDGAAQISVLGRNPRLAVSLCGRVKEINPGKTICISGDMTLVSLEQACGNADILINATPLGMASFAADFPSTAFLERLPPLALVCDLVYNPPETSLLGAAARLGLPTMNGLDMLFMQALLADEHFLGIKLDKPAFLSILRGQFNNWE